MQAWRACAIRLNADAFCVQRVNADALDEPLSAMAVEDKRGATHRAAMAAQVRSPMCVARPVNDA